MIGRLIEDYFLMLAILCNKLLTVFRQYTFQRILNVEHNHDPKQGDRYLVELVLEETTTKIMLRFSEYLYQRQGAAELCYPHNIRWNKKAVINIIVTSGGNQARWIHHFVDNMARIYNTTKDSNFNVIIVDFHDSETKLKSALERSAIPNYMLLQNKGRFHKTLAIQHAADMVIDPNEIVFVVDLHLEIPANILDEIRKVRFPLRVFFSCALIREASQHKDRDSK